jgi:KDO2-lipid IV(A) lauroyltransferase
MIAGLNAGRHFGLLIDQKMNDGISVPFFGRDAMTAPAMAQFAVRDGTPLLPVRCERLEGARFRLTFYPPLEAVVTGDRQRDVAATMAKANALLEAWIRERPEQWLWIHNRWPD